MGQAAPTEGTLMMDDNEVCANCGHVAMSHGYNNGVCGNMDCDCQEFKPSDVYREW